MNQKFRNFSLHQNQVKSQIQKGLFTFYREQQEFEQYLKKQKKQQKSLQQFNQNNNNKKDVRRVKKVNQNEQCINKQSKNNKINNFNVIFSKRKQEQKDNPSIQKSKQIIKGSKSKQNQTRHSDIHIQDEDGINAQSKQSIEQNCKVHKIISNKNYGDSVVIIQKSKPQKCKQNKTKHVSHPRYRQSQGYFIKKRSIDLLTEAIEINTDNIDNEMIHNNPGIDTPADLSKIRMKLHKLKHISERRHLEGVLSSGLYNSWRQNKINDIQCNSNAIEKQDLNRFIEGVRYINMLPEIKTPEIWINPSRKPSVSVKRVPPKILRSISKSGNIQMIRSVRKDLQQESSRYNRENEDQNRRKNHSFIEYTNLRYDDPESAEDGLNQKQGRIINILNKFRK